jgi:hypothetical protein
MIRESVIDASLNRLSSAFGRRLLVRPPATAEETAKLEHLVGPLPREFVIFLLTCNGLRIRHDPALWATEWSFWHAHEMISSFLDPHGECTPPSILPFSGDPMGRRDCPVNSHGPARGAVVRWDPCAREVELLASSFGHYFDRWCDYHIEWCASQKRSSKGKVPSFDAAYIAARHSEGVELQGNEDVAAWLHELDHIEANGDDFE